MGKQELRVDFTKIGTQFAYRLVRREISGKEGRNLRNIILASHGSLAEGMLSAVRMIVGSTQGIAAYGLDTYKTPQDIYQLLKEQIEQNQDQEYQWRKCSQSAHAFMHLSQGLSDDRNDAVCCIGAAADTGSWKYRGAFKENDGECQEKHSVI